MLDVAQIVGEMPSRSKCAWLRGIVHARDHLRDAVLLLRELADDHVVLVVAGQREHDVRRARDPGALEHVELGRVAALHLVLELVLEALEAVAALLDQRHLLADAEQRARDVRADLAAAGDDHVHQTTSTRGTSQVRTVSINASMAVDVGQTVRMPRAA